MNYTENGDFSLINPKEECDSASVTNMDCAADVEKTEAEFHLANDTVEVSPRSGHSGASSSEIFSSPITKEHHHGRPRPKSARISTPKAAILRTPPVSSSIPLPVKTSGPIKIPSLIKNAKSASRTSTVALRTTTSANKHTLEIQFINKNKRFVQMRKEIVEKQRPILDLYQNLLQIKKRLEQLGKNVKLEEIKLIPYEEYTRKPPANALGAGEQVSMEVVNSMKSSIEEIPKTLMDICKNLLSRRALIVELLESVTKAEIDVGQVSDKIESLKGEGQQLQQSLDGVIQEHEAKISILVCNWQKLLNDKQSLNTDTRIEELEQKIKEEETLREESSNMIHELHKKMDERRATYDRSIAELNGVLQTLRDQIKKLEQDLEIERKTSVDFKSRNNTNAQNLKSMRMKITELENEKKDFESANAELQRKVRSLQDQLKHKETQWTKEKEDMSKSLKHQENLLQKLTADKNQFETRLESIETAKSTTEDELRATIASLTEQFESTKADLSQVTNERDAVTHKCTEFEQYVARMNAECKENMNKVSYSIEWGKAVTEIRTSEADNYMQDVAKDLRIRELEDKIDQLENERERYQGRMEILNTEAQSGKTQMELNFHHDRVKSYQMLLEEGEHKLKDKATEMEHLRAEIRQLKVRQESLEEQNERCSPKEMQRMLDEGRQKLKELMNKSIENESKLDSYIKLTDKQKIQMNEMDNLLRYRENMANVLKSSRNELLMEKDSLAKYSREIRAALMEMSNQSKMKDALIKTLEEKSMLRENQMSTLEKDIRNLEDKLHNTNEKRFKLQETVGNLERELQKLRGSGNKSEHFHNNRSRGSNPWSFLDSVYEVVDDKPNKKVAKYCNSFMDRRECERDLRSTTKKRIYSEFSTSKMNVMIDDDKSSIHTHCHHKANSRSLISLSLQTVDFIKTKLDFLSSVNTDLSEDNVEDAIIESNVASQLPPAPADGIPSRNLSKILELTAKRYEYLQNQAHESYDDLANLVKLAVSQKGGVKK